MLHIAYEVEQHKEKGRCGDGVETPCWSRTDLRDTEGMKQTRGQKGKHDQDDCGNGFPAEGVEARFEEEDGRECNAREGYAGHGAVLEGKLIPGQVHVDVVT